MKTFPSSDGSESSDISGPAGHRDRLRARFEKNGLDTFADYEIVDVQPSEQDKLLTRALVLAAAALQIKVIDHSVVFTTTVFSFRKEGLL